MVDFWTRMINRSLPEPEPPEPLNADKIEAGYRLFWTKQALTWDAARRTRLTDHVAAVTRAPEFEPNALIRRYRVAGLDDSAHSGASLLMLLDVLRALDAYETDEDDERKGHDE